MIYFFLSFCLIFSAFAKELPSGITYQVEKGGVGTHLLSYMRAKWLSYLYEVPVRVKPFPYFNQLVIGKEELKLLRNHHPQIAIQGEEDITYMDSSHTLYILPTFAEVDLLTEEFPGPPYIAVEWKDSDFLKILKKYVTPNKEIKEIALPKDRISVALHVRSGLPSESKSLVQQNPLKYPSIDFYIEQIERINTLFNNRPLYVFIFTDAKEPADIAKSIEKGLTMPHVKLDWHKGTYNYRSHVVDDLFNMMRFTCLVRPQSNYSLVADILGDHKIVLKPVSVKNGKVDGVFVDVKQ